jgi:hypothetical protein
MCDTHYELFREILAGEDSFIELNGKERRQSWQSKNY